MMVADGSNHAREKDCGNGALVRLRLSWTRVSMEEDRQIEGMRLRILRFPVQTVEGFGAEVWASWAEIERSKRGRRL